MHRRLRGQMPDCPAPGSPILEAAAALAFTIFGISWFLTFSHAPAAVPSADAKAQHPGSLPAAGRFAGGCHYLASCTLQNGSDNKIQIRPVNDSAKIRPLRYCHGHGTLSV